MKLAYETDNIQSALPVIDKSIVFYPGMANTHAPQYLCDPSVSPANYMSNLTGLTDLLNSTMVMEYDLLCGLMYVARQNWSKAQAAFERVASFPTKDGGCSKIMVEAYKKWILVALLVNGRGAFTPPHVSAATTKTYQLLASSYLSLAAAFTGESAKHLQTEAAGNAHLWMEDANTGLVEEVLSSYQKWRVLSLQDVYTKISIPEVRKQTMSAETGLPLNTDDDVEMLIQNMIIAGMLKGVIEKNDDGTKFLTFLSPVSHLAEVEFKKELERARTKLKELGPLFHATNQRLSTSKEYIRWAVKETKHKSNDGPDPTLGFESHIDDEDLMTR